MVMSLMCRAQKASAASVVGKPAMMCINRREVKSKINEKPFNAQQTGCQVHFHPRRGNPTGSPRVASGHVT